MARIWTAGFWATVCMTAFMYLLAEVGFPEVDLAKIIGETLFGSAPVGAAPWWLGQAIHIFLGSIVFPLAFYVAAMILRGLPSVLVGWLLGVALFLGGEGIAIPLTGGGFFSSEADQQVLTVLEDFLSHTVYGLLLGYWAAPAISSARASEAAASGSAPDRPS